MPTCDRWCWPALSVVVWTFFGPTCWSMCQAVDIISRQAIPYFFLMLTQGPHCQPATDDVDQQWRVVQPLVGVYFNTQLFSKLCEYESMLAWSVKSLLGVLHPLIARLRHKLNVSCLKASQSPQPSQNLRYFTCKMFLCGYLCVLWRDRASTTINV